MLLLLLNKEADKTISHSPFAMYNSRFLL